MRWNFIFGSSSTPERVPSPAPAASLPLSPLPPAPPLIVPPPIPAPMVEASPSQTTVLTLEQAPAAKRQKTSAYEAKKKCMQNQWWCICRPKWPAQGRQWHTEACPREKWARTHDVSPSSAVDPAIGERVTALACAGPRAGRIWEYRGTREKWVEVTEAGTQLSL